MPRLNDDILDSVLYLYPSVDEAKEGINIGGSGFLVAVPSEVIPRSNFPYVVTNRHVIEKADVVRLNTKDGGTFIQRLPRDQWIRSPTDDLAIHPVAIDATNIFAHNFVHVDMILTQDRAARINLGIGDNVFMVGRFINHEGQRNAPIVRLGNIAQMPFEPLTYELEGKRHDQLSIIADIRSIGGYSGSPVFLSELNFLSRPDATEQPNQLWLIGIDLGAHRNVVSCLWI